MSTKKSSVLRFTKIPQVFDSKFLMVLALATCNYIPKPTSSLNFTDFL